MKYEITLKIHNPSTKKDFEYKNFVYTKIEPSLAKLKLKLSQTNESSATLKWDFENTESSCFVKYNVELTNRNNETIDIDINSEEKTAMANNLSPCEVYSAVITATSARNEQVESAAITFTLSNESKEGPKSVEIHVEEFFADSVNLFWTSDSASCLQEHQMLVYDNKMNLISKQNVFERSTIITNLSQCTNYSVELIDQDKNVLAKKSLTTPLQFPLDEVKVVVDNLKAEISWPKIANRDCLLNFNVTYKSESCSGEESCNSTSTIVDRENNLLRISSLPPSEQFHLTFHVNEVTSRNNDEENVVESRATRLIFNTLDRDIFRVNKINEFRNSIGELQISWAFDQYLVKFLNHFLVTFDGIEYVTNKTSISLSVAACKKNYSVIIQCVGKDGSVGNKSTKFRVDNKI